MALATGEGRVVPPGFVVETKVLGEVGGQAGSRRGAARFGGKVVGRASLQLLTQAESGRGDRAREGVVAAKDVPGPPARGGHGPVQSGEW